MKLMLADVQTNAKGGRFVPLDGEDGPLRFTTTGAVEVLWEPGNYQDDGARRVNICFSSCGGALREWVETVEASVLAQMVASDKPFPGTSRTELQSQLQSAIKTSAKGEHIKMKIHLDRCLFWDAAGKPLERPAELARRRGRVRAEARQVWLMNRQWGVLFEVRHVQLEPLEPPTCPFD